MCFTHKDNRFRDELENSFEQSGFLNTSDLTVIQSLVLYTVGLPYYTTAEENLTITVSGLW